METLIRQYDFWKKEEYILTDMIEQRIKTESKMLKLCQALIEEYKPRPGRNIH